MRSRIGVLMSVSVLVLQHPARRPRSRSRERRLQQRYRDAFQNGVHGDAVQTIPEHDEQ